MFETAQGRGGPRTLFDRVQFSWTRSPVHIEGAFRGEPDWEKLRTSTEGRQLLACARDWPRLTPGIASWSDWDEEGGVFVLDLRPGISGEDEESIGVRYEAFREIPLARPPLYQQFAGLPLHLDNHLCAFARNWGFPQVTAFDGKRTGYSVLALQYQSRLLRLTLEVLTELRRKADDIYRPNGPLKRLLGMWLLPGVADRVGDGFILPPEDGGKAQGWDREEWLDRPFVYLAAGVVQNIFSVQLGPAFRIEGALSSQHGSMGQAFRGCRPILQVDFGPDDRVRLGPAWTCDSLLQRIWIQAFSDIDKAAALTQCCCGCSALLWLRGKQLSDYLGGKRTWASGHRASAVSRERRERLKAKHPKQYLASEKERLRVYRAEPKKRRE